MIIAANYPAKKLGLTRGTYMRHIKERFPTAHVVHVDTISAEGSHKMHDLDSEKFPDQQIEKVSLQRYREESSRIMSLLEENCELVEKASIDEAYLDITKEAEYMCEIIDNLIENDNENTNYYYDNGLWKVYFLYDRIKLKGKMFGERFEPKNQEDKMLAVASEMAENIREDVFNKFGYTCSAGIAHNKLLAKIGSGLNKPNGQTVIPNSQINEALQNVPIEKVKYFLRQIMKKKLWRKDF